MNALRATTSLLLAMCTWLSVVAQTTGTISVKLRVVNEQQLPLANSTVELLKGEKLVKIQMTDTAGYAQFWVAPATYICHISRVGYTDVITLDFKLDNSNSAITLSDVVLHTNNQTLQEVKVSSRKPFIEIQAGRTLVNLEASTSAAGSNVLETLEKLPGITVDKDGKISLKGKAQVLILIDGKQTYLSGSDLAALLSGMSASQLSQVEIMTTAPARYDASGSAGIINLKTKKNNQKGFNGSLTTSYTQGRYPKNNNTLIFNYRSGKLNLSANYTASFGRNYLDLYADRTYYKSDGTTIQSYLEQPNYINYNSSFQSARFGLNYSASAKTTLGLGLTGVFLQRDQLGHNSAIWQNPAKTVDSTLTTTSTTGTNFKNGGVNLNLHHAFSHNSDLAVDVDYLNYSLGNDQYFQNIFSNGTTDASKGNLPTGIKIYSAKADYEVQNQYVKWGLGWKSSRINTDNLADYYYQWNGATWMTDYNRTNHFLYNEYIHAAYGNVEAKLSKWNLQGGLRFESTNYDATQMGNPMRKDSSFSRDYNSLFPAANISYTADSVNTFSFSAGRRIDRPAFQKLNPFSIIINKYTYQVGNPYYLPQYTWNLELSHLYKNTLITTLSYSRTTDYFSQIFYADNGIVTYTEGNLGMLQVLGLSLSAKVAPTRWWSFAAQAVLNHRIMQGQILKGQFVQTLSRTMNQGNFSLNNQFKFGTGWSGELSGTYNTRSRQDIQELLEPSGQLSLGVSKTVLQNKGTIKLAARDLFYTQAMIGFTEFQNSNEYFSLRRDTRVLALSFTYRFGKAFKSSIKRSIGSATEEAQRVGTGN
ncbi:MAG: hypothetical protein C4330_11715 [Chitinophagaceae bacterium]